MINEEKLARIQAGEEFRRAGLGLISLDNLDTGELLALRAEIDIRLPSTSLQQMDLEKELVLQYHRVQALQERVLTDLGTPANQLAQVSNAVASTLQQLVTMQTKFHTSERFKEIESRLIRALDKVPEEYLVEFFEWYESQEEE